MGSILSNKTLCKPLGTIEERNVRFDYLKIRKPKPKYFKLLVLFYFLIGALIGYFLKAKNWAMVRAIILWPLHILKKVLEKL